jgi:hypothetical protein
VHLQGVAHFRGVPQSKINLLANTVEKAIGMALKDYKTARLQWSARQLKWMRAGLQNDPYLDASWGAEEHAVVRRFLTSVTEMNVDRVTVAIVARRYLEDPRDYNTAIARGLSEAGDIRRAVRRHEEEARILRSGGHSFREGIAEIEKVRTCAPAPLKDCSLHSNFQRATPPSRVSEPAISRFEHARLWVQDGADEDEDRRAYQVASAEHVVSLATAVQKLCHWKRMHFEGREDNAANRHKLVTDVNAPPALGQD